jgi:ParB-like chromosome segregation protein Spo0J
MSAPDLSHNPVSNVIWVPIEKVFANNYNPNNVAISELRLLYTSIKHDGYTMPIVTIRDDARDGWIIIDGLHRFTVMKRFRDIYERNHGLLPIVVLDKSLNDRMASTVRHNRARGKHSIQGMGTLVMSMLENGWGNKQICEEIGLEPEELARLKHITGYAKLYENAEYSRALETPRQIESRLKTKGS